MAFASRISRSASREIADIERQVSRMKHDLENRLSHLNTLTRRGATHASRHAAHYVHDVAGRFRDGATSVRSLTDDATRFGNVALRRIGHEVEQRPLLTLAIVAGIAALLVVGMAARRDAE